MSRRAPSSTTGEWSGSESECRATLLEDAHAILSDADEAPADLDALVVGTGPGSFTSTRIGLADRARSCPRARDPGCGSVDAGGARRVGAGRLPGHRRETTRGVRRRAARRVAGRPRSRTRDGVRRQRRDSLSQRRSSGWARSSHRTTTRGTSRTLDCTRRSRPASGRSMRSSPSTCACPMPRRRSRERRAPPARDARPGRSSRRSSASRIRRRGRASMFDAELRKPSALALGAFTESDVLVGYAFVSRYVDAWHVMNVAVADSYRRRGIASALLERLFAVTRVGSAARLHARGARLEHRRDSPVRAARASRLVGSGAATTRTIARTHSSCGATREHRAGVVILGIETSCDETAAALDHSRRPRALVGRVVAGRPPRALRRCRPRGRIPSPSRARGAGRSRGARVGRHRRSTTSSASLSRRAQVWSARSSSASRQRRRSRGRAACRSSPWITSTGISPRSTSSPIRSSHPSPASSRAAGTRCSSRCGSAGRSERLGTTLDDAAGEAFDKGAQAPRSRLSGRRGDRSARLRR